MTMMLIFQAMDMYRHHQGQVSLPANSIAGHPPCTHPQVLPQPASVQETH